MLNDPERRARHTQRVEDMLLHIILQRLPGELLNDLASPINPDAVDPTFAWLKLQRDLERLVRERVGVDVAADALAPYNEIRVP